MSGQDLLPCILARAGICDCAPQPDTTSSLCMCLARTCFRASWPGLEFATVHPSPTRRPDFELRGKALPKVMLRRPCGCKLRGCGFSKDAERLCARGAARTPRRGDARTPNAKWPPAWNQPPGLCHSRLWNRAAGPVEGYVHGSRYTKTAILAHACYCVPNPSVVRENITFCCPTLSCLAAVRVSSPARRSSASWL